MTHVFRKLLILGLALIPAVAAGQQGGAPNSLDRLTPFFDTQTIAVLHLDIRKVDVPATMEFAFKQLPADLVPQPQRAEALKKVVTLRQQVLDAGFPDFYLIVSLADLPMAEPFAVFPAGKDAKPEALREVLKEHGHRTSAEMLHGAMVVGLEDSLTRVRQNKGVPRPDLAKALAAAGDAALRLAVSPSDDTRRALKESLPKLPPELGGIPGGELADGFSWLSAGASAPPKLSLQVTLQAKDARSAQQMHSVAASGLDLVVKNEQVLRDFPPIKSLAPLLLPKVEGDRLVLKIDEREGNLTKIIDDVVKPAAAKAREAAQRAQSSNNLKQLILGMHVHHDTVSTFPPRASVSKEGKELLSWRVHLLPYLEQNDVYEQFHLDEPWDSEHNKKLIAKMPKLFAAPDLPAEIAAKGMTTYVVPVGPKTAFEGTDGISLTKILDGTSNTIAIVEVAPEHAVVWTKPDDWKVDFARPLDGVLAKPAADKPGPMGFQAAFCDGSVRYIAATVDKEVLRRLLQKDDGEPIGDY
jgi:hypothetical protein